MSLSRRELLTASALFLSRPKLLLAETATKPPAPASAAGRNLITMCWNENPYGPGPAARAAMAGAIADACRYPDDEMPLLAEMLAKKEGVSTEHIVIGTGSGELLCALGSIVARDAGEIIAAEPTFLELTEYAHAAGATAKFVPVDALLRHDLSAMRDAVNGHTRAVYICNPNNPTGTTVPAADIRRFVDSLPERVMTIVDEAYLDFSEGQGIQTVVDLVAKNKRVVLLRTFSKIHGMAGTRCGYAITRPEIAAEIAQARMTTPNVFAMRAARASLGDHAFLADTRRRIVGSRTKITTELKGLGMAYAEPQGNFVFFDTGMPLAQFTEKMIAHNIRVGRRFPPFENWCRITIGTEPEVEAFLGSLRTIAADSRPPERKSG
jgi:histidinol-phosphate aminotransferase